MIYLPSGSVNSVIILSHLLSMILWSSPDSRIYSKNAIKKFQFEITKSDYFNSPSWRHCSIYNWRPIQTLWEIQEEKERVNWASWITAVHWAVSSYSDRFWTWTNRNSLPSSVPIVFVYKIFMDSQRIRERTLKNLIFPAYYGRLTTF